MNDDTHPSFSNTDTDPFDTDARRQVGYSPAVRAAFELSVASTEVAPYRVARVDAEGCVLLGESEPIRARVAKKIRQRSPLVVGDWVAARERRGELGVRQLLARRTSLIRRAAGSEGRAQILAANLDRVLICTGLDRDFRLTRLERWLSLVHESGAEPAIILTKAGLVDADERAARLAEARGLGEALEVVAVDVIDGLGLDELAALLAAREPWASTLALVGSSGVGKSTLLNYLGRDLGLELGLATGSVSAAHGKGRHTTSDRELFVLSARKLVVIDTPGLREVGIWGAGAGIDATFAEIHALAEDCRFRDCAHAGEPGCAVAAAIEAGELDPRRLESMRRLAAEQQATARRASEHARREHERSFAKLVRRAKADKRRQGKA